MKFYNSTHCQSKAHCHVCRTKEASGVEFRKAMQKIFADIKTVNFECPFGVSWGAKQQLRDVLLPVKLPGVLGDLGDIIETIPDHDFGVWLKAMLNQCAGMLIQPPKHVTCKTSNAFRRRCEAKIKYYLDTYFEMAQSNCL